MLYYKGQFKINFSKYMYTIKGISKNLLYLCIHFRFQDIDDDKVKEKLKSKSMDPHHLVIFKKEARITAIYIICDFVDVKCQRRSVTPAVVVAIAVNILCV